MSDETKTLAQQYHEAVEALKATGMSNADAIRKVAEDFGKEVNSVRGGIHQYTKKLAGGGTTSNSGRGRRAAITSVEDHLANARNSIEEALSLIDREVEAAKAALETAQSHFETVSAGVKERKADLEKKLKALA